ncbi:MAG: diaminopimelate epimerase [Bacteroidales bacterium]
MKLQFSKYHGTGNDFIMVDSRKNVMKNRSSRVISNICDRHFGIGADGLIILDESDTVDFSMIYYNADGHPGSMCGNGGRCITAFANRSGWIKEHCSFEAADGIHKASILPDGNIKLEMRDVTGFSKIKEGYFLDTGSPHLVLFVEDVENLDVFNLGREKRYSKEFKEGTNVNFVQLDDHEIYVRTYERGVENETLSCGTGVVASAIAASLQTARYGREINVKTKGGKLHVIFEPGTVAHGFRNIYLTGPATNVFDGTINL